MMDAIQNVCNIPQTTNNDLRNCCNLRKLPVERVRRRPPQQCPALTRDVSSNANVKSCENCSIIRFLVFSMRFCWMCYEIW